MSFLLVPVDQLTTRVVIKTPGDNGKSKIEDLTVTFRKMAISELESHLEKARKAADGTDTGTEVEERARDLVKEGILDITGIKDEHGEDIPFTDEILDQLFDMTYVSNALVKAFYAVQRDEKVKN